jgi:uncharacterized protein YcfJ
MFNKVSLGCAALAMSAAAVLPTAASAQRYYGGDRYAYAQSYRDGYNRPEYRDYREYRGGYDYRERGDYRRCHSGAGGTIIGAIAGGLLGNAVAGYGDRGLGTVLGAGAGALAGNAISRSDNPGYCR